jgi:uncharacterized Fe-S center protein
LNITGDCDCLNDVQKPIVDDIGIIAARDPVAIDKASLDLFEKFSGKTLRSMSYPAVDPMIQLKHGEEIGLGSLKYELVNIE